MRTAICPGSFDPITLGHMDVIERAAALFDRVVVCVMVNGGKDTGMFPAQRRLEFVRLATEHLPNVDTARWDGLLAEFARRTGALCLLLSPDSAGDPEILHLPDAGDESLRSLEFLPALQVLAAELSAARGIDTAQRRYPDFFSIMGSKMEGDVCQPKP